MVRNRGPLTHVRQLGKLFAANECPRMCPSALLIPVMPHLAIQRVLQAAEGTRVEHYLTSEGSPNASIGSRRLRRGEAISVEEAHQHLSVLNCHVGAHASVWRRGVSSVAEKDSPAAPGHP